MDQRAQQQPPVDKTGLIAVLVVMALMFGYYALVYAPARREWEEKARDYQEWQRAQAAQVDSQLDANGDVAPTDSEALAQGGERGGDGQGASGAEEPAPTPTVARDEAVPFETPEHAAVLSTAGASLRSLTFKHIRESVYAPQQSREADLREPELFQPLHLYHPEARSYALLPLDPELADVATRDWEHRLLEGGGVEFSTRLRGGLVLKKTYLPPEAPPAAEGEDEPPKLYHMRLRVEVINPTGAPQQFGYYLYGPAGMVEQDVGRASYGREYVLAARDPEGQLTSEVDVVADFEKADATKVSVSGKVAYWGLATKYFTALAIPDEGTEVREADAQGLLQAIGRPLGQVDGLAPDAAGHQGLARGLVPEFTVPAGGREVQEFLLYVGPRQDTEVFDQPIYEEHGLDELVYFGWFGSMGRLLIWVLQGLHAVVGNWGVSILLLTFIVRGMLMPLSMWSQRNMFRMQKLGPEINKLKEKYSSKDGSMTREQQQAFQAAQMELWRKHEVNPVGCIGPLFLQMPIFIGLYNALNYSFLLRHSEFALWITDLSTPDVLFRLPFSLPLLGTNAFSVLPLVMVATYVLQQQLQPKPTDERMAEQQRVMKWIMPLFGFLFYTMPSGLMLYFITSSTWGIAEQKVIKSKLEAQEGPAAGAGAKGGGKGKKAAK